MTLTVYEELEQGSDAWLQARCGLLTASTIGKLITPTLKPADNETSRNLLLTLAMERVTGHVEYMHPTFDMQRGTDDEPWARDVYAEKVTKEPVAEVGFIVREFDGVKLGYSPDGLVGDTGLLEIKSRKPNVQARTILTDQVPAENRAQLQAGLFVTGREWIDYVSYRDGMPLYVKRVHPDEIWFDLIERVVKKFEADMTDLITNYTNRAGAYVLTEKRPEIQEITF